MKNGYELETFESAEPYKITFTQIKKFNLHWHNYIEVYYVKKGSIWLQTGDFSFHLDEGHICFIDSNTIHSVNRTDVENQIITLQIPIDKGRPFSALKQYKFNSSSYLADFSKDLAPLDELRNLLENIYKENNLKISGYQQVILGYIHTFFGLLIRRYYLIEKNEEDYIAESSLNRLSEIIEYLDEHYTDRLTLKELAERLHMNYFYLSHFFKDTSGISFQDYLNNLRIDKSLSMLSESNTSITEIAYNTGFPNIKAYTKAFQKKFGMLPSAYKKNIMSKISSDPLSDETIIEEYLEKSSVSNKSISATNIFNRLQLTPQENRHFVLNYYINIPQTAERITCSNNLITDMKTITNLSVSELNTFIKNLSSNEVIICAPDISDNDKTLTENKLNLIDGLKYSFDNNHHIKEACKAASFTDAYTMLGAIRHILDYISSPLSMPDCYIKSVSTNDTEVLFNGANTYMTPFNCPSPYYFSDVFIHSLKGELIFRSEGCVVFFHDNTYQILCCHKKSFQMYQSLKDNSAFDKDDYLFFVGSYPHMRYTFSFGISATNIEQTSYSLSEENGSIVSNWIRMGSPKKLTHETADYLFSITKPAIITTRLPFRDQPIVSVEVPPLGISYIELKISE